MPAASAEPADSLHSLTQPQLTFSYAATADIGAARLYSSAASRRQSIITAIGPTGSGWKTAPMRR